MNLSMIASDCEIDDNISDNVSDCSEEDVVSDDNESDEVLAQSLPTFSNDLEFVARIAQETMILDETEVMQTINEAHVVQQSGEGVEVVEELSDSPSSEEEDEEDDIAARADEMQDYADEEEDISGGGGGAPLRTKHEVVEDDLPAEPIIEDIPEYENISLIGEIMSYIQDENTIVIQSIVTNEPLDEGSLLCLRDKTSLGKISEIFGPLTQPFYIVKFKSQPVSTPVISASTNASCSVVESRESSCEHRDKEFTPQGGESMVEESVSSASDPIRRNLESLKDKLAVGVRVFAPVGSSAFVTPLSLQNIISYNRRGTDASNLYDEEVAEDEAEFSDDEQEQAHKKQLKLKKGQNKPRSRKLVATTNIPQRMNQAAPQSFLQSQFLYNPPPAQPFQQHYSHQQHQHQQTHVPQQYGQYFPQAPLPFQSSTMPPPPPGPPPGPTHQSYQYQQSYVYSQQQQQYAQQAYQHQQIPQQPYQIQQQTSQQPLPYQQQQQFYSQQQQQQQQQQYASYTPQLQQQATFSGYYATPGNPAVAPTQPQPPWAGKRSKQSILRLEPLLRVRQSTNIGS